MSLGELDANILSAELMVNSARKPRHLPGHFSETKVNRYRGFESLPLRQSSLRCERYCGRSWRIVPRSRGQFGIERDWRRQRNGCSTLISHISIRRGFRRFRSCERGCKETYAANRIARSVRRNSARSCPVFPNRARADELFFSLALIRSVPFLSDLSGRTFRSKSDGFAGRAPAAWHPEPQRRMRPRPPRRRSAKSFRAGPAHGLQAATNERADGRRWRRCMRRTTTTRARGFSADPSGGPEPIIPGMTETPNRAA